jgi:hypothetical protein
MQRVTQAVRACSQGEIPVDSLRTALDAQLSRAEQQLAFIELNKDVDLHSTLVSLNEQLLCRDGAWGEVARHVIRRTVEGDDTHAMAGRAAVSVAGDVVGVAAFGLQSVKHVAGSNFGTNLVVCLILSSIDTYRWSVGEIRSKQLVCNVGEHVAGCSAAVGGAVLGAGAGVATGAALGFAGGPLAPITTVLGALLGGFIADVLARKAYQAGVNSLSDAFNVKETEDEARQRAMNEAAAILGIDLQRDGFALAKSKFRSMILSNHPDRAQANHTSEDSATAARIIAAWQIVRGFYELRGQLDDGDGCKEPEAFVVLWVMKTWEAASNAWQITRTWFGDMQNAPIHHGQTETVERYTVYM